MICKRNAKKQPPKGVTLLRKAAFRRKVGRLAVFDWLPPENTGNPGILREAGAMSPGR